MRHRHRTVLTSALALVGCLGLAVPAVAATADHEDPAGDVTVQAAGRAAARGAVASTDITSTRVVHGRERLRYRLGVRDTSTREDLQVEALVRTPDATYEVHETSYRDHEFYAVFRVADEDQQAEQVCIEPDVTVRRGQDAVWVSLSRECLGDPRWVRYGAVLQQTRERDGARLSDDMWLVGGAGSAVPGVTLSPERLRSGGRGRAG